MTKTQKYISIAVLVALAIVAGVFMYMRASKTSLSDDQIREKFACNRMTLEYRETDIFCSRPELYRNPQMTEAEYTAWQRDNCKKRSSGSATQAQEPGQTVQPEDCDNLPDMHDEYVKFIENIRKLRETN